MDQDKGMPAQSARLIGDPGYTILEVASTISNLSTTNYNSLLSLAMMLQLPTEKVEHVRNDILCRKPSFEIIVAILTEYRSCHAENASIEKLINGLNNLSLYEAASMLSSKFLIKPTTEEINSAENTIWFHVTPPSIWFTGRTEYQKKVTNSFSHGETAIICQSIVGLGGIGKTDLARKAVDHYIRQDENSDLHVIWLNAETEQDLASDFILLTKDKKALCVDIKDSSGVDKDIQTIIREVYTYFKDKRCLFVFDNAENEEYLVKFLPSSYAFLFVTSTCRQPHVLITSREDDWSNTLNCSVVKLGLFSEDEAILFVQKVLQIVNGCSNTSNELGFVKQLISKLDFLPLAIKQAAFYIAEQMKVDPNYGCKMYLDEWEQSCRKLLDKKIVTDNKTTYTTWETTINKIAKNEICGEVAVDVLKKLSFMTPDRLMLELFEHSQWFDKSNIREAFTLLLRYSMISHANTGFSIHRLVQQVTMIDMQLNNSEESHLEETLCMLTKKIHPVNISQVQSAWRHARRYKNLVAKYTSVSWRISLALWTFAGLKFAMEFAEQELEFLHKSLPEQNNLSVLRLEAVHCRLMYVLGRGESGYDQLWKKVQKVLKDGGVSKLDLAVLLWYFCSMDSEKKRYPDAWRELESILCSMDVSSCDEKWACKFFEYGMCLYFAADFASSFIFFKKADNVIDRTQSKNTNFKQRLDHWLQLTSMYTYRSVNTQAHSGEPLQSLCRLLQSVNERHHNKLWLAFETSFLLFYKFGEIDEALSICRYYLFINNQADGVSFNVPNTLNQKSILLCEQKKFQEALECLFEAESLANNMQYGSKSFFEMENRIHLARALDGVGRQAESLNMIMRVLPELLFLERRDISLIPLIFMNIVAAEVLLNNQNNHLAQQLVKRAEKLMPILQINVSMPFLFKRINQMKQKLNQFGSKDS